MAKLKVHPNLDREVKKGVAWAVHAFTTSGIVLGFLAFTDTRPDGEKWELIDGTPVMSPSANHRHPY